MFTISILGRKGGTGKTTLSLLLAWAAHQKRMKAAVIKLEGTIKVDRPFEVLDVTESYGINQNERWNEVVTDVVARQDEIDLLVIDSAANALNYDLEAIDRSDLCLIPTTMDDQSLDYARRSLDAAKAQGKMAYVVANLTNKRSHSDVSELLEHFSLDELLVSPDGRVLRIPTIKSIRKINGSKPLGLLEKRAINNISSELYKAVNYTLKEK